MKLHQTLIAALVVLASGWGNAQASQAECYEEVEINNDMMQGAKLSNVAIVELERNIKEDPGNAHLRVKAAGYYLYGEKLSAENSLKFSNHVLWLIDKCPSSYSIGNFSTYLDSYRMSEAYTKARSVCLDKLESKPIDIQVVENAVKFFMLDEKNLAEKYLDLGLEVDPTNERLLRYQGMLGK